MIDSLPRLIFRPIMWLLLVPILLIGISADSRGKTLKVFILTGQSNSLGTLATTDVGMHRAAPGSRATEQAMAVPFFWDNRTDGTDEGDEALGDSGGVWVDLGAQDGGFYPDNDDHWGPELGFARMLWNAGYRDFGIVKASRGGGGNSYWVKDSADDHMYDHVVDTASAAIASLPAGFTEHEVVGLLYLQGESNNSTEADEAGLRFDALLANLKAEFAPIGTLAGVFGEIGGGSSSNRDLTRSRQRELAGERGEIGYAASVGLVQHDGLHYAADSQLLMGERMAAEMIGAGALGVEPLPLWGSLHAWYVSDSAAQPSSAGEIERWASLNNGTGTRDLTRTVGGRPSLRAVTAVGEQERAVMDLTGDRDLWASSAEFSALTGDRTVAVFCRVADASAGFLFDGSTSSGRTRAQVRDGEWQAGVSNSSWDVAEESMAPLVVDQWQRHAFVFEEGESGTQVTHWVDGVQLATALDESVSDLKGFIIGANGGRTFQWLSCDVAEVAVYDRALDAAEIAALSDACLSRWGTPAAPPFGVSIHQVDGGIPRFGKHGLLRVSVNAQASNATKLDELSVTLKGASREAIASVSVIKPSSGSGFDPAGTELASVVNPSSDQLTFELSAWLEEGANHFWVAVEPERWAPLGTTLDGLVSELTFSGENEGAVVPDDGDPAGELSLALVPMSVDVRTRGAHGLDASYRIPGIAADGEGVLHAVYDNRYNFGGDLPGDVDVAYNRSLDGGATWEAQRLILDYDASVPGSSGNGVGDPCILWDPVTDTLWVAALWSFGNNGYNGSGPGTSPEETGQYVLTKSEDGGDTWSDPINITVAVKDDPNWNLIYQGPGHGLAMRDGTLVFPSQYRDGTIANDGVNQVRSCSIFSADHGETWDFGSAVPSISPQTNENTVCELDDGRLLFSCRTPSGSNGQRAWAHYTPAGPSPMRDGSWEALYRLPEVPDPVVQGSVIQWKSTWRGDPQEWLLFANPATGGRNGMTLRVSVDGGASWPVSRLVYSGASAYSSLCILPDHSVGLFYEKDGYQSLNFVRVELDWLLSPDLDRDGDGLADGWELIWGTDPDVDDADLDPDGDGMTNKAEALAGTNPLDEASVLRGKGIEGDASVFRFSWSSVPGKAYQIEESTDLKQWLPIGQAVLAESAETEVEIADEGENTQRFIRAVVLQ